MPALQRLLPQRSTGSKKTSLPDCSSQDKIQPSLELPKLNLTIAAKIRGRSRICPTFPCALWFQTKAKVMVFCVNWQNCQFKEEREWEGQILGRGIHGFLNALLIKHRNKTSQGRMPLMGLLTICATCHGEPSWHHGANQLNQVVKRMPGSLILGLSEKEIEEVVSSKEIIMEGVLMDVIKTISRDLQLKEWDMLRPLLIN